MRTLSGTTTTQFASHDAGDVVLFVQMDFSPVLRLHTGDGTINYSGNDWLGTGAVGSVEEVADAVGEHKPLRFTLTGVDSSYLAVALGSDIKNIATTVSLCVLSAADRKTVVDVLQMWTGKLDQMPIRMAGGTCTISVTAEHAGTAYARPKPLRYTDDDQQRLYPGDTCCRFVVSQSQKQDVWPAASLFRQ